MVLLLLFVLGVGERDVGGGRSSGIGFNVAHDVQQLLLLVDLLYSRVKKYIYIICVYSYMYI